MILSMGYAYPPLGYALASSPSTAYPESDP